MIQTLAFANYRSLCDVRLRLATLTVITGGNGTGKSNIYRALRLLVDAANGELGRSLAREGGMGSAISAGDAPRATFPVNIDLYESVLSQLVEPHRYPVLSMMRERLRRWRFYHQIRTDADAPARAVQIGARTPVLSHDGSDLAAALQTIFENGNGHLLAEAVRDAFAAKLAIEADSARFRLLLAAPGVARPLDAAELSDGTLRYLALLAALHSPRPPELLVLNEPETSLHPSLLAPLARQIVAASALSQLIVVTHAAPLVDAICGAATPARPVQRIELVKHDGATVVDGHLREQPAWTWTS